MVYHHKEGGSIMQQKADYIIILFDNENTVIEQIWCRNTTEKEVTRKANQDYDWPKGSYWRIFKWQR